MSQVLASLKLINAKRQNTVDPVLFRRSKLNEKLKVQIAMAQAMSRGESFSVKRMKKVTDEVSGESSLIEVAKRTRTWWLSQLNTWHACVSTRWRSPRRPCSSRDSAAISSILLAAESLAILLR